MRDLEHLALARWQQPIERRKHGSGRPPTRDSRAEHGTKLDNDLIAVTETFDALRQEPPGGIDPKLVFNLRLHPSGMLQDDELRVMGLRLIAREPNKLLVVFPDEGTLDELRRRIHDYETHEQAHYANIAAIEAIEARQPADKMGSRLQSDPLRPGEVDLLDVSLWHPGDFEECRRWINDLSRLGGNPDSRFMSNGQERVTDSWIGNDICLLRMRVDEDLLDTLLQIDFVRSVDRRARSFFEFTDIVRTRQSDITIEPPAVPLTELTGILVVDSGVMQGHPLLAPIMGDAQSFVAGDERAEDVDANTGGHGTAVAGIAAYGDIGTGIRSRAFWPNATIFSGRILDENLEFEPEQLREHQLEEVITYFLEHYPSVRVVNLSIGNRDDVFAGGRQSALAAAIDELAYRFQSREVLFIVPTGNYIGVDDEEIFSAYPHYLQKDEARLIEPATSAIALTVGGVAYGPGTDPQERRRDGVEQLVAQNRGWPSPFTRAGPGVDKAIKPEIVDFAGDVRFERGRAIHFPPQHAGVPSTSKAFGPPDGRLFRTVAGTSFAVPRVANLAARLYQEFPGTTSNLVRALIAASAQLPEGRPPGLQGDDHAPDVRNVYGYGTPDYDRARFSSGNEVLLLAEEEIALDHFQIFELPSLPEDFLKTAGEREIAVTLAFDPPTRQTRGDSYLGVRMRALLFRNMSASDLTNRLAAMSATERAELEDEELSLSKLPTSKRVKMLPGVRARQTGTLQRGIARWTRPNWSYNNEGVLLAIVCQRMWASAEVERQRYAVVVSIAHSNPRVELHAHIRERAQMWQEVRIRI